jgi:hypothetical protein
MNYGAFTKEVEKNIREFAETKNADKLLSQLVNDYIEYAERQYNLLSNRLQEESGNNPSLREEIRLINNAIKGLKDVQFRGIT